MYQITHRTTFEYSQPVAISHHVLRLTPRPLSPTTLPSIDSEV